MSMRNASGHLTICEILRKINDVHQEDSKKDKYIREWLAVAETMAKKMSYRLYEYNKDFDADWWDENPEYEADFLKRHSKHYVSAKQKKIKSPKPRSERPAVERSRKKVKSSRW